MYDIQFKWLKQMKQLIKLINAFKMISSSVIWDHSQKIE